MTKIGQVEDFSALKIFYVKISRAVFVIIDTIDKKLITSVQTPIPLLYLGNGRLLK